MTGNVTGFKIDEQRGLKRIDQVVRLIKSHYHMLGYRFKSDTLRRN